jgi:hypothetical protein
MKRAFYDKYGEEKLKEGFYSDGSKNSNFVKFYFLRTQWRLSFQWEPRGNI